MSDLARNLRRKERRMTSRIITVAALVLLPFCASAGDFRVTLLGSGENFPQNGRLGPSILIEAGDQTLVFDAGRGALQRFYESGASFTDVSGIFFTHLHSDHVIGFPGLWLGGWHFERRESSVPVFGPAGTREMVEHLKAAFSFDIGIRIEDDRAPPEGVAVNVTEVDEDFVWRSGDVVVRAIDVDHRPIEPAFGYRIDYGGYSVVLSGDTRYTEKLIEAAKGTDILIHEVGDASAEHLESSPGFRRVLEHHTSARDVGRVFAQTTPRLAVYAHMVLRDMTFDDLIQKTRETYDGPLVIGEDLMTFDIGNDIGIVVGRSGL